jgi:hypothetical protein
MGIHGVRYKIQHRLLAPPQSLHHSQQTLRRRGQGGAGSVVSHAGPEVADVLRQQGDTLLEDSDHGIALAASGTTRLTPAFRIARPCSSP